MLYMWSNMYNSLFTFCFFFNLAGLITRLRHPVSQGGGNSQETVNSLEGESINWMNWI